MESIGVGLLGYGMIGKVHALGYRELPSLYPGRLPPIRLAAVATSSPQTARAAAAEGGFEAWYEDYRALIRAPQVQVVDCSLPNDLHAPVIREALSAGRPVLCEKPLTLDAEEARELARLAQRSGAQVGMMFQYRFVPAIMQARRLIESGALGAIYSFRMEYLHSGYQDPERPIGWRMQRGRAGGGALADLGSHLIDLVRYLLGEPDSVRALLRTWVRERPLERGAAQKGEVTVDDAAWLEVRLAGGEEAAGRGGPPDGRPVLAGASPGTEAAAGVVGTLEVSRFATGALDDLRLRIHGERGALRFDLLDANWLYWYDARRPAAERGWTRLETVQNYPEAAVPPGRAVIGWTRAHAENLYRFLRAVAAGEPPEPGIVDGLKTQLVLGAAYASAERGDWVQVPRE